MQRIYCVPGLIFCLITAGMVQTVFADQPDTWYRLGPHVPRARVTLTVSNPSDHPMPHARVDIPLKQLQASLHGLTATTLLLVDPDSPGKRLGESHGTLVPFSADVDADALTFLLNMPAKAHRRLEIYQLQSPGFVPAFEKRTDILEEQAYRAFENDQMAFRIEIGKGANTSGMTLDVFAKTQPGLVLRRFYGFARDESRLSYHRLSPWGMDILHVGMTDGLGCLYLKIGDDIQRPAAIHTTWKVLKQSSICCVVQAQAPVKLAGMDLTITRTMTLTAGDRGVDDVVEVSGPKSALEQLQLGLAVRSLENETWTFDAKQGIGYTFGKGTEQDVLTTGLGFAFDPKAYLDQTNDTAAEKTIRHMVLLRPVIRDGKAVSHHTLMASWDKDAAVHDTDQLNAALRAAADILQVKAVTQLGQSQQAPSFPRQNIDSVIAVNPSVDQATLPAMMALAPDQDVPAGTGVLTFAGQRLVFAQQVLKPLAVTATRLASDKGDRFQIDTRADVLHVTTGQISWQFNNAGLVSVSRAGKTLTVRDPLADRQASPQVHVTQAACVVEAGGKQYLLFADCPVWMTACMGHYNLTVDTADTARFLYAHTDPHWNPRLFIPFMQKRFYLNYPGDFVTLFNDKAGLGLTMTPTASSRRWVLTQPVKGQRNLATQTYDAPYEPYQVKEDRHFPIPAKGQWTISQFTLTDDPQNGQVARRNVQPPMLMVQQGEHWIHRRDIDGDGVLDSIFADNGRTQQPDFDQSRFTWDMRSDGSAQAAMAFGWIDDTTDTFVVQKKLPSDRGEPAMKTGKPLKLRTLSYFADIDQFTPDGILDSRELTYPTLIAKDWSGKGAFTTGSLFDGGPMASGSFRMQGVYKHYQTTWTPLMTLDDQFVYRGSSQGYGDAIGMQVFDLDGDGDQDAVKGERDHPDSSIILDLGDMNPLVMMVFDPTRGYVMANGGEINANNTDGWTGFWGGDPIATPQGPFIAGHHDWPQMVFSLNDKPAPTHRCYSYAQYSPQSNYPWSRDIQGDMFTDQYKPMRMVVNLDRQQKDIDGSSYVSSSVQGFRHWNTTIYPMERPRDDSGKMPFGVEYTSRIVTFTDHLTGKFTRAAGPFMPEHWDGRKLLTRDAAGKPAQWLNFWDKAMTTRWQDIVVAFNTQGTNGPEDMHACLWPRPYYRWDAVRQPIDEVKFYTSPILGSVHLVGAQSGHLPTGKPDVELFNKYFGAGNALYDYLMYSLDIDIERYYYASYLAYLDLDRDHWMDTYLWDEDADGLHEFRAWYDQKSQTLSVCNNRFLARAHVALPRQVASLRLEDYDKLHTMYAAMVELGPMNRRLTMTPKADSPFGGSLIPNGSFELTRQDNDQPLGWEFRPYTKTTRPLYPASGGIDGKRCIGLQAIAKPSKGAWSATAGHVLPGQRYRFTGWYYMQQNPGEQTHFSIRLTIVNTSGANSKVENVPLPYKSEWSTFEFPVTMPEDAMSVVLYLDMVGQPGTIWYDDIRLEAVEDAKAPVGDTPQVTGMDGVQWQVDTQVPRVMVDLAHAAEPRQQTPLDLGPAGFSRLLTGLARRPCLEMANVQPFTSQSLQQADVLVMTALDARKAIDPAECTALKQFVESGGKLVLALGSTSSDALAAFAVLCDVFDVKADHQVITINSASPLAQSDATMFGGLLTDAMLTSKGQRIYFNGVTVSHPHAQPLVQWDHRTLALQLDQGQGQVYVFGAGGLLGNAYATFRARDTIYHPEKFPRNNDLIDLLADWILLGTEARP